ncbi:MAG: hypothetical protein D6712_07975 [Chloroflexi bacterium]|nr:MAG: hypothetical protein D6712_07975 [Chloroflexota bacterium]
MLLVRRKPLIAVVTIEFVIFLVVSVLSGLATLGSDLPATKSSGYLLIFRVVMILFYVCVAVMPVVWVYRGSKNLAQQSKGNSVKSYSVWSIPLALSPSISLPHIGYETAKNTGSLIDLLLPISLSIFNFVVVSGIFRKFPEPLE